MEKRKYYLLDGEIIFSSKIEPFEGKKLKNNNPVTLSSNVLEEIDPEYYESLNLLPHQLELSFSLIRFEKRKALFFSDIGTGKMSAIAYGLKLFLNEKPSSRFLIISPSAIQFSWKQELESKLTKNITIMDYNMLLKIKESSDQNSNLWEKEDIIISSIDFIKKKQNLTEILNSHWDIVIFDESQHLKLQDLTNGEAPQGTMRGVAAWKISNSNLVDKLVFLSATLLFSKEYTWIIDSSCDIYKWKKEEIVNWNGEPIFEPIKRTIVDMTFHLTDEEKRCYNQILEFIRTVSLSHDQRMNNFLHYLLIKRTESSMFAIERTISNILLNYESKYRNLDFRDWPKEEILESYAIIESSEDEEEILDIFQQKITLEKQIMSLKDIHAEFQKPRLKGDSKLQTILKILKDIDSDSIVIFSSYLDTIKYLKYNLEDIGFNVMSITGQMNWKDRLEVLSCFKKEGGILILSDGSSEGISLSHINKMINYDIPWKIQRMELRTGRLDRLGQTSNITIYNIIQEGSFSERILKLINKKEIVLDQFTPDDLQSLLFSDHL